MTDHNITDHIFTLAPAQSMADNWALATGTEFIRARMATVIDTTFGNCPENGPGRRLARYHRSFTGFAHREPEDARGNLLAYRRTSRGHSKCVLSPVARVAIVQLINSSPQSKRLAITLAGDNVCAEVLI